MAVLSISLFKRMARDEKGNIIPIGEVPAVGGEALTFTTAVESKAFKKSARFIRLLADADCYLHFGKTGGTVTLSSGLKLESNVAEYFGLNEQDVRAGTMVLHVYDGSS